MIATSTNRNIELKARVRTDFGAIQQALQYLGASYAADLWQRDVYFHCAEVKDQDPGRLKLRGESPDGQQWQWWMIWYRRADRRTPRPSDYLMAPLLVPDPVALVQTLDAAWQKYAEVDKHRQVWWHQNIRIHLDEVVNLDRFVEFEAVVNTEEEQQAAHHELERLKNLFQIDNSDLVDVSYGDLIRSQVERIRR
jgi:adenylate cyclase class 2